MHIGAIVWLVTTSPPPPRLGGWLVTMLFGNSVQQFVGHLPRLPRCFMHLLHSDAISSACREQQSGSSKGARGLDWAVVGSQRGHGRDTGTATRCCCLCGRNNPSNTVMMTDMDYKTERCPLHVFLPLSSQPGE